MCDVIKWWVHHFPVATVTLLIDCHFSFSFRVYHEDRPYWYVKETNGLDLLQHRLTCETTSGYPSKHVMSVTGFLIIVGFFSGKELGKCLNDSESKTLKFLITIVQYILVILMGISRMYFGCHFLHQCLAGAFLATVVLCCLRYDQWKIFTIERYLFVAGVMALASFVISIYYTMITLDYDPHWPVRMAFKWCARPEYLKHESTPIFSLCRDFGTILGAALSAPLMRL